MADLKRINHIITETDATYHDIWARLGLSDSAADVLYTLSIQEGPAALGDIIRLTGIPKQTLNSALRKMEGAGLVELRAAGGRKKLACLTPKGEDLARSTVRRVMEMENAILDAWSEADLTAFMTLNQRYLTDLREKIKEL